VPDPLGTFTLVLPIVINIIIVIKLKGTNITNGEMVAIKLESVRARHPQLEYEARVYKALAGGGKHIYFMRQFSIIQ
jgi:hypothetical protein